MLCETYLLKEGREIIREDKNKRREGLCEGLIKSLMYCQALHFRFKPANIVKHGKTLDVFQTPKFLHKKH